MASDVPQENPFQPIERPINSKRGHFLEEPRFLNPMYNHLETNIPTCVMGYAQKPFQPESPLFPSRQETVDYLESYGEAVRHLVSFCTQVEYVAKVNAGQGRSSWLVKSQNLVTGERKDSIYDAVAVCPGHHAVPYIPNIHGISHWRDMYPHSIDHSKFFDSPLAYKDKKVLVVGYSASGLDISYQITTCCKLPLLISTRYKEKPPAEPTSQIVHVPEIAEFLPKERAIRFENGHIEHEVDHILFCTGYLYSFPCLSLNKTLVTPIGFRVQDLYQHLFYIPDPTLVFPALPFKILPLPLSEAQAAVVARIWSGRLSLPSQLNMFAWERDRLRARGDKKAFHAMEKGEDFEYQNWLWDWAASAPRERGRMARKWTEKEKWIRARLPDIRKAYVQRGEGRREVKTIEELGFRYGDGTKDK